jgi:hypothetical protein
VLAGVDVRAKRGEAMVEPGVLADRHSAAPVVPGAKLQRGEALVQAGRFAPVQRSGADALVDAHRHRGRALRDRPRRGSVGRAR